MSHRLTATVTLAALCAAPAALGQWVTFEDVTDLRLPTANGLNDPSLTVNDDEEKDYAWGDVDNDGDIDLIVVRKQPFTSTGRRVNLLLMNEGVAEGHSVDGVFVDRTVEYATASDVPGDEGFLTPTNDRDVVLVDVNLDGWLDIVTAPTLTDNSTKALSHPRVYMNLGEVDGVWQGFRHEDARIPQMHPTAGPRFCSVAAGDLTGDGYPDLYFGDYDSGGSQIFDYNNKLLVNDGNGFFVDESDLRLTSEMRLSAFGAASVIADMNNDGALDVVKQTALNAPQHVAITYNSSQSPGEFVEYDIINQDAPYFVSVGDLNNDGLLDVVVVDDGTDTYHLNTGPSQGGFSGFTQLSFPSGPSAGFGGNSFIADLNNDGWQDVIITDVDVDIPGCQRVTAIYRNDGDAPNVGFDVPPNGIPQADLTGVHDVAVIDIDQDGWLDLIIGLCDGTRIYRNVPPQGIDFEYPQGRPDLLVPDEPTEIVITADSFGGEIEAESLELRYSIAGPFQSVPFVDQGDGTFAADLPGVPCLLGASWYVRGVVGGSEYASPAAGEADPWTAVAATGTEVVLSDSLEGDVSAWTVSQQNQWQGFWEAATPNGTVYQGSIAAPFEDATPGDGTVAFVTGNGPPGGSATSNDVDGGPAYLETPVFDGTGETIVRFKRWLYCNNSNDTLDVQISNNGGSSYSTVPSLSTGGTNSEWEEVSFRVGDVAFGTTNMRIRFRVTDQPNDSVTEAGIDDFSVETLVCTAPCPTDVDGSGATDFGDLVGVLSAFGGPCEDCPEDVNGDGAVSFDDLLDVLAAFGPCP